MIKAYFRLVRPFTSFPPILAVVLGSVAGALYTGSTIDITVLIVAVISMTSAQIFGQITNQLADPPELDRINNKYRVLVTNEIDRDIAWYLAGIFLMISLFSASLVNRIYLIIILFLLLCTYLYNFEPVRLKKRFLLNNLILGISRGFVPVIATWSVFSPIVTETYYYAFGLFIWVFGWQTTKDIPDTKGDREFGIRTIPVVLGKEGAIRFISWITWVFWIYHLLLTYVTHDIGYSLIGTTVFVLGLFGLRNIEKRTNIENTFGWIAFYLGIVVYYLMMLMIVISRTTIF